GWPPRVWRRQDRGAEGRPKDRARAVSGRARAQDRLADQPRAFVTLLRRLVAERETDVILAAALVREERRPRRVLHARGDRELRELLEVRALRQLDPEEEAALGPADGIVRPF